MNDKKRTLPVSVGELELMLAVVGAGATAASLLGVSGPTVVTVASITLVLALALAVLLAHRRSQVATVHLNGAWRGRGYASAFRRARRSLLLIHLDDDAPDSELRLLYRRLLDRGVQVRRLVIVRPDHRPEGIRWIHKFGPHAGLRQRFVKSVPGSALSLSFAIVDESTVLMAVPGFLATESELSSEGVVLRHLIELRHPSVTRAFLEVYESAWKRAVPLELPQVRQAS